MHDFENNTQVSTDAHGCSELGEKYIGIRRGYASPENCIQSVFEDQPQTIFETINWRFVQMFLELLIGGLSKCREHCKFRLCYNLPITVPFISLNTRFCSSLEIEAQMPTSSKSERTERERDGGGLPNQFPMK